MWITLRHRWRWLVWGAAAAAIALPILAGAHLAGAALIAVLRRRHLRSRDHRHAPGGRAGHLADRRGRLRLHPGQRGRAAQGRVLRGPVRAAEHHLQVRLPRLVAARRGRGAGAGERSPLAAPGPAPRLARRRRGADRDRPGLRRPRHLHAQGRLPRRAAPGGPHVAGPPVPRRRAGDRVDPGEHGRAGRHRGGGGGGVQPVRLRADVHLHGALDRDGLGVPRVGVQPPARDPPFRRADALHDAGPGRGGPDRGQVRDPLRGGRAARADHLRRPARRAASPRPGGVLVAGDEGLRPP